MPTANTYTNATTVQNILQAYGGAGIHLLGSDTTGNTVTNATAKQVMLGLPHYTNAEQPVGLLIGYSGATWTNLFIGGGDASLNAATTINFQTAANSTTTTGSTRLSINSAGLVRAYADVQVDGDLAVNGGDLTSTAGSVNMFTDRTALTIGGTTGLCTIQNTTVAMTGGTVQAGLNGTTRGVLEARQGASGNTPGVVKLAAKGGGDFYLWVTDAGVLRIHNALPTADTDGSAV